MTPTRATALVVAVLCLTGCGEQTARSVGGSSGGPATGAVARVDGGTSGGADGAGTAVVRLAAGQPKPQLDCPTGERSVMIADFAHRAEGARAPQDAIGEGVVQTGERLVVSHGGSRVWVLRADGTVRMEVGLVHHDGWLLHQRTLCG
jgi:hypothetical protein